MNNCGNYYYEGFAIIFRKTIKVKISYKIDGFEPYFQAFKKVLIIFINSDNKSNSKMNASSQYEDKCALECVLI